MKPTWRQGLIEATPVVVLLFLWAKLLIVQSALEVEYTTYPLNRRAGTATLALLLLGGAPLILLPCGLRLLAMLLLNTAASTLVIVDLLHLTYFGDVVSVADFSRAPQAPAVLSSVIDIFRSTYLLLVVDILVLTAVLPLYLQTCRTTPPVPRRVRVYLAAIIVGVGLVVAAPPAQLISRDEEALFDFAYTRRQVALALGLLPYHVYDVALYAAHPLSGRLGTTPSERETVLTHLNKRLSESDVPCPLYGVGEGANVILLMVESLQHFVVGLHVEGQPVTPHLNSLAQQSMRFTNFFDQTHLGNTSDGEFVSLQSLHPIASGAVATRFGDNELRGVPRVLREHGYATMSIVGQPGEYWNMRGMHARLGFQRSEFADGFMDDRSMVARALPMIAELADPFLVYLMTFSTHHPFTEIPPGERRLAVGRLEGSLVGRYLQTLHYFDHALGDFIHGLQRAGLLEKSVLVLYGDHRARLTEDPEFTRLLGLSKGDDVGIWLEDRRLPLLIRLPHGSYAGDRGVAGGHLDVAPTILGLLGITANRTVMLGRDLLCEGPRLVVFRDGSFTDGDHHFVRRFGPLHASLAWDGRTQRRLQPSLLDDERRRAEEELLVSDIIIEGDLIEWASEVLYQARLSNAPQPDSAPYRLQRVVAPARTYNRDSGGQFEIIGHRGDPQHAPENTLASIAAAFEAGATMVEVDVQLTRDGVPVLMHDFSVDRTTNGTGLVRRLTLKELKRLDAGSWYSPRFSGERVPTLEEALEIARGHGPLLIDPKVDAMGPALAEALTRVGGEPDALVLGSWDRSQFDDFAQNLPDVTLLWSGDEPRDWRDPEFFKVQRERGVDGFEIGPPASLEFVAAAHAHGFPVYVFTVNDRDSLNIAIESGVDGIETDVPAVLAHIVASGGGRPDVAADFGREMSGANAAATRRTYALVRDADNGEMLLSSHSDTIQIGEGPVEGFLDHSDFRSEMVSLVGWAGDVDAGQPADSVLVFLDGKFIATGTTGFQRPDLVEAFDKPDLLRAGFYLFVPAAPFRRSGIREVRVFAFSGTHQATELRYGDNLPWRPRKAP